MNMKFTPKTNNENNVKNKTVKTIPKKVESSIVNDNAKKVLSETIIKENLPLFERVKNKTSQFQINKLPSGFLPYPENSRIIADTYSYGEIKRLSDSKIPLDIQYEILLEGIHVTGFDKKDITFFDFIFIGVLRKLSSIKDKGFSVPFVCPRCKKQNNPKLMLSDLGFSDLEVPKLPVNLTLTDSNDGNDSNNTVLSFNPLTIGGFIEIFKKDMLYQKNDNNEYIRDTDGNYTNNLTSLMASQCTLDFDEAYKLIFNITDYDDIALLNEVDLLLGHGLEAIPVTCNQKIGKPSPPPQLSTEDKLAGKKQTQFINDNRKPCGYIVNIKLDGGEALIRPFRADSKPTEHRIDFGNEGNSKSI